MPYLKYNCSFVRIGCIPVFMTTNSPFGRLFSSSGESNARSAICKLWLLLSFPLLMEPVKTVRLPRALESVSAVWLFGAKPPKIVS